MTNTLSDQARQARNAYMKQWREKNSEKLKEYTRRYWEGQAKLKDKDHAQE